MQQASQVHRSAVRGAWGAGPAPALCSSAPSLQPWKRPADLLRAFAKAKYSGCAAAFAGEGPLRSQLESEAASLGVASRVRFLGFVNQSQLPAVYASRISWSCLRSMSRLP